jgi:hypothetical protein|tara:strand:+ start:798 stop:1007 length:210 start_codon:yes stop_codon:yes gene_type:complete
MGPPLFLLWLLNILAEGFSFLDLARRFYIWAIQLTRRHPQFIHSPSSPTRATTPRLSGQISIGYIDMVD